MKCPLCSTPTILPIDRDRVQSHLIVAKLEAEKKEEAPHIHLHGPWEDKEVSRELIQAACERVGISLGAKEGSPPREIIFRNKQRIGDTITMTAAVRDFKKAFPETRVGVMTSSRTLWKHNPYVDLDFLDREDCVVDIGPGYLTNKSNQWDTHMINSYRLSMEQNLGLRIPPGESIPDLWMTEEEIREPIVQGPYWIITVGGEPNWPAKMYPIDWWQEVVDRLQGVVQFVQLQLASDPYPRLKNVIDLVGKTEDPDTGVRDLLNLFYHAQGSVGLVSMQMHMAAAFGIPCVVVAAAREPSWFTHYLGHQYLSTEGTLPCSIEKGRTKACWKCGMDSCREKRQDEGMGVDPDDPIPPCVALIRPSMVEDSILFYYRGGRLKKGEKIPNGGFKNIVKEEKPKKVSFVKERGISKKDIILHGSLSSRGGGEQSLVKIKKVLEARGWNPHLIPWGKVHDRFRGEALLTPLSCQERSVVAGLPILFYANDQITEFCQCGWAPPIVEGSGGLVIGINYVNGELPRCEWLSRSGKLKAVLFQNEEKREEFLEARTQPFDGVQFLTLPGAIDLENYAGIPITDRQAEDSLVVLKHCVPDFRKYVTSRSVGEGRKIHVWQKEIVKEDDIQFYSRLLKDLPGSEFRFMEAHPELVEHFKGEPRMVFFKFDQIPVAEFLSGGHVYLYRTSNLWRDQFPRVVGEALASGLPVLTEPRDGTKDRVQHGDTGFHCVDYDGFLYSLKLLKRKEQYRRRMGEAARRWALKHLDPFKWSDILADLFDAWEK